MILSGDILLVDRVQEGVREGGKEGGREDRVEVTPTPCTHS